MKEGDGGLLKIDLIQGVIGSYCGVMYAISICKYELSARIYQSTDPDVLLN